MNKTVKIRVNFSRENLLPNVNMSLLCDILISKLSEETKKELINCKDFDYSKINYKFNK